MPPKSQQEIVDDIRKKAVEDFLEYLKSRDLSICHYIEGTVDRVGRYVPISTEAIASYGTK